MPTKGSKRRSKQKKKKIVFKEGVSSQNSGSQDVGLDVWGEDDLIGNIGQQKNWVRDISSCDEPVFFGIQESKLEDVDHFLIRSLWPRSHVDWAFSSSIGASGGIITMWDSRVFMLDQKISNRNFLGLIGTWRGQTSKIGLLNVYSPQSSSLKEQLWLSIEEVISMSDVIWIVFGDFNVVRCLEERFGSNFDVNEANTFNDFIARNGLCDLPLGGRRFTRFDKEGRKLDRLVSFWESNNEQNKTRDDLKKHLLEWDIKAEEGLITDYERAKREEWLMDLDYLDRILQGGSESIEDPDEIKKAAYEHFSSRFKESRSNRPCFSSSRFQKLSDLDAHFLDSSMSVEEIKEVVWGCASSKAPGPDGFNFKFIKTFWDVIKVEFLECIKYFESSGRLANGCNPSFIVLIPKRNDPLGFGDYRPISLIGCVYKVISKILSNRLARVIASVISPNQAAFISGRQILDGILVANEIIRMASVEDTKLLIFKVDFEKAFDSVNWSFLLDTMGQMGFGPKWRRWIASCLLSASILILVNGSPSKEFKLERGLRQGDPLSPFLFLIVAEALQVSILEACDNGIFKGIFLANSGANLSLLQYADDALFFGEWSRANALNLIHILRCFELASGLKVNIDKSRVIGVNVPVNEVVSMAASLGCSHDALPFFYLGLPVGKRMNTCDGWNEVIHRFRNKLSSWKANTLSIGGRLTLVKAVLGSLPIYYFSLFKAPQKVINTLESI
ncbi:RNA-directed DNA polymerase, eukaryota [Tanacetum coccineum]